MSVSTFDDWQGSSLQHFGTRGMKWGVRKYQYEDGSLTPAGAERYGDGKGDKGNRSARGVSRDLRRLEKERAGAQARADYYKNKTARAEAKAKRRAQKAGKPVEMSKHKQKLVEKAKQYQKLANDSKQMTNRVIKNALSKGYSINSRDTMRFVRKGADKALAIIGRRGTSVNSIKYHVHNDGLGVRKHKKSIGMINRSRHRSNFL